MAKRNKKSNKSDRTAIIAQVITLVTAIVNLIIALLNMIDA